MYAVARAPLQMQDAHCLGRAGRGEPRPTIPTGCGNSCSVSVFDSKHLRTRQVGYHEIIQSNTPDVEGLTMIEFQGLTKRYGDFCALQPLEMRVERGELFGFLGPNGAGKTTTIRMMMGILVPSGGRVKIADYDVQSQGIEVKRRVGYLPDSPIFYDYLRGREILQFVAQMHGIEREDAFKRCQELMEQLALTEVSDEFAVNYSMGMKKKLGLACALIHRPEVLILDEPTNGLD